MMLGGAGVRSARRGALHTYRTLVALAHVSPVRCVAAVVAFPLPNRA